MWFSDKYLHVSDVKACVFRKDMQTFCNNVLIFTACENVESSEAGCRSPDAKDSDIVLWSYAVRCASRVTAKQ